jgi:putative ABC transport system permease protein
MRFAEQLPASLRSLRRHAGFAAHAVLILALGIGATSAVFNLIYGVLLTPPPYAEPEELVLISPRATTDRPVPQAWSQDQYEEWQEAAESLESVAGYRWTFNFLVLEDGSAALEGMVVTSQYFDVTGLTPQVGRAFTATDVANTETPSIILGHDLWQRQFGGDPSIVGRTVRLSRDAPRTVIGVMPPDVRFLPSPGVAAEPNYDVNARVDYWIPMFAGPQAPPRSVPTLNVVARLSDGFTAADAQAELAVITARQAQGTALTGITATVESAGSVLNADGRNILLPLLAAAALVLLISCGNAAALLLVRGLQRRHEYGVRSANGASRTALFKHVLAESLLLAALGGAVGVALGAVVVALFKSLAGNAIPRLDAVSVGSPILLFGVGAALFACALAGLFPAWRASRLDPVDALRGGESRSTAGHAQRQVLGGVLVLQMSLTLALLVVAGLLVRTMANVNAVESGYDTSNVVTMSVTAVDGNWADFHERTLERVAALPGVDSVAFAWGVPLTGNNWPGSVEIEGYAPADGSAPRAPVPMRAVTPGYFGLLGQTIEDGRDFTSADRRGEAQANGASADRRVAIVNRTFAERYWPDGNAIGKRLWQGRRDQPALEIVGVVSAGRTNDLTRAPEPELYMPLWQAQAFSKHLVVRASVDVESITRAVQREIKAILPTVGIETVQTLDNIRATSLAPRTFAMQLLVGFAVVASVLTLAGVYSVLSLSVTARRREIAIRAAVGAARGTIMGMILRDGLKLIAVGIVIVRGAS